MPGNVNGQRVVMVPPEVARSLGLDSGGPETEAAIRVPEDSGDVSVSVLDTEEGGVRAGLVLTGGQIRARPGIGWDRLGSGFRLGSGPGIGWDRGADRLTPMWCSKHVVSKEHEDVVSM